MRFWCSVTADGSQATVEFDSIDVAPALERHGQDLFSLFAVDIHKLLDDVIRQLAS